MGIFGTIGRGLTGPFRAIGNLAQGKVRKAIGALGDTGKLVAPVLGATGVGLPLAAGVGAASGAASSWGRGQSNIGKIAMGGLEGAAYGAGGHAARGLFAGGVPGLGSKAVPGIGSRVASSAADIAGEGALSYAGEGALRSAPGIGSKLLSFVGKRPDLALQTVGTGLQAYGASREGAALDRRTALEEEAMRREWEREENMDPFRNDLQAMLLEYAKTGRMPFDEWKRARV